ncbi:hypothetical protein ES319_D05G327300v1 [Gossypium barbadense]|uniref:Uncharacterized protein n=2 Tax=Gossypium TaxID=3633 RepID=A0A5J5RKI2_GOSBA|nr:hypothetical protein ES319_D05G327300v1 [Gossypium barbadense]TYG70839.1 hypothetical protein ES288_D05G346700v1 [Gossypium darwinii]
MLFFLLHPKRKCEKKKKQKRTLPTMGSQNAGLQWSCNDGFSTTAYMGQREYNFSSKEYNIKINLLENMSITYYYLLL